MISKAEAISLIVRCRKKLFVLPVTADKKIRDGGSRKFFIIYFYVMMSHVILLNNS